MHDGFKGYPELIPVICFWLCSSPNDSMVNWWRVKGKWSMLPPSKEDTNAWSTVCSTDSTGTCCCVQERVFITRKWGSPGKGQGHWMTVSSPEPPYGNANTTTPQLWFLKPSLRTQWRHCGERAYITLAEGTRNDTTSATGSVQGEDYIHPWFSHLPDSSDGLDLQLV